MKKLLPKKFFDRPVLEVTKDLLGKTLVRMNDGERIEGMIIEAEAYDGEKDLACHASKGKTPRTCVMYGDAGNWYVYLCYGMHYMLNIVTGAKEYPAAILIRGIELSDGKRILGPGRVTTYFKIDKNLNEKKASKESGLWIEDGGVVISPRKIKRTPRIGIENYAGPIWSKKPYRFLKID